MCVHVCLCVWVCVSACVCVCVCVSVCVCAPLASSPPGHHMQSWEPRLAPSVGLMPSLSPKQLAPTSLIILAGAMQEHTHTHIVDTLDGAKVYHTMTKSAELGKVFLKFILAVGCEINWRLHEFIILSGQTSYTGKIPIKGLERRGEERRDRTCKMRRIN